MYDHTETTESSNNRITLRRDGALELELDPRGFVSVASTQTRHYESSARYNEAVLDAEAVRQWIAVIDGPQNETLDGRIRLTRTAEGLDVSSGANRYEYTHHHLSHGQVRKVRAFLTGCVNKKSLGQV